MNNKWLLMVGVVGLVVCAQGVNAESDHRIGVGANYWKVLDDVDVHNIDEDGFSWMLTYQYRLAAMLKLEADLEMFPEGFQGIDSAVYAPEAYLVLGSTIYAAAGAGILYADGDFADDPFYALRAGLDLEILPQVFLDLNVNYRFAKTTNLSDVAENVDTDTMTLGAALRLAF
jgi:hypothetical protein